MNWSKELDQNKLCLVEIFLINIYIAFFVVGGIQVYGHKENVHVLFNYVLIIVKIKIKVNKRVLMNAEVCSVEWKFINMSQQEEDLILRMYRLVGDRYILSSFLSFPRSCIMAFLIICNDFTTQHM